MVSVIQGRNSIFKMKTGLRAVLRKTGAQMSVNFLFKEGKSTSTTTGDNNFDKITSLNMLQLPLMDLEGEMINIMIFTEPLATQFVNFQTDISTWNLDLMNDVNDLYAKVDDTAFVLSKVKIHYYKIGPAIIRLKKLIAAMKVDTDNSIDSGAVSRMEQSLQDMQVVLKDLKKSVAVKQASKDFQYLTLSFNSSLCLFPPCIDNVNVTLYPFKYDMGLTGLCHDPSKGLYDIWQTDATVLKAQKKGNFFNFKVGDKLYLCLSVDGVKKAKLNAGIEVLGTEVRDTYILSDRKIKISARKLKLFGKYDFMVNSTVNLELSNWNMASIKSYGYSNVGSNFIKTLQKRLDEYTNSEKYKLTARVEKARETVKQMLRNIAYYRSKIKEDKKNLDKQNKQVVQTKKYHEAAKVNFNKYKVDYDRKRAQMLAIENEIKTVCTIKTCPFTCIKIPKCNICQDTYYINKTIPSCKVTLEDRSYGFLKSEKEVCSHVVESRRLKYTGTCKQPTAEPKYAQSVIDRLNKKTKNNESLTLEDAYSLESIDPVNGKKLREQIEKKVFFENFPRRLQNVLLTEEEFKKLEVYTNKTFADKTRKQMKQIKNALVLRLIMKKLNESQQLLEEDYLKLKEIDPQLEKRIRKSQAIAEITRKIQLTGNLTDEDLAKLRKIAPEYSRNLTDIIKKQEIQKQVMQEIQKKIGAGTLSVEDIEKLEKINPSVAEKLKAALKEQLKQKVKEMEKNLKTVKGALDAGFNNSEFNNLQNQLNTLSGSLKHYDKETLRKLQEKILANNATSGSVFEEVYERLDLGYQIKNLTGKSEDMKRVVQQFFAVLPKFDVPNILQRSALGVMNGLQNIQEWFQMASKLITQACEKCGENCAKDNVLQYVLNTLNQNIKSFSIKICKSNWGVGVKIQAVTEICSSLSSVQNFLSRYQVLKTKHCTEVTRNVVVPLQHIVNKWKDARTAMEKVNQQQWKKNTVTITMMQEYAQFSKKIQSAFSAELNTINMAFLSESDILMRAGNRLTDKTSVVSLAQFEVLNILLTSIVAAIEKLPNNIKQNDPASISTSANEASYIKSTFKKLTDRIITSLNELCEDKKPDVNPKIKTLPRLIIGAHAQLSLLLSAKTLPDIFKYSQRFSQFAKPVILFMNEIKSSMMPCTLRQEKIGTDQVNVADVALNELKLFLRNVQPLGKQTIQDLANDIKKIMAGFKNGISSPIGKLVNLMSEFVDEAPSFNVPMMLSLTPKTSLLTFYSLQEYLESATKFFVGIQDVLVNCDDCKPEDIFGKSNLIEISTKLDKYLKPISKNATAFLESIKVTPRGLSLLTASLEEIRTALQTLTRSGTGFSKQGITNIITAFKNSAKNINLVRDGLRTLYNSLAGIQNVDVKEYKNTLEKLSVHVTELYKKSKGKLNSMKEISEKMQKSINQISNMPSNDDITKGVFERRLEIVAESAEIINHVGGQFEVMYSMGLDSGLMNYIDTQYAPAVSGELDTIKNTAGKLLNDTKTMVDKIGIELPILDENTIFGIDIAKMINDMISSMGIRKSRLAKALSSASKSISVVLENFSKTAEKVMQGLIGGVSKYKNQYVNLKQRLEKYGKMFDEVEDTLKEIRDKPLSKIGDIKNAADELIDSIQEYDLTKLLSADPKVVPRKIKEMQTLFHSSASALKEIDSILKKCKTCNVEKIFGYNYLKSLSLKLATTFSNTFKKLNLFGDKIGDTIGELQDVKKATEIIKSRFENIVNKKNFGVDTFKELSEALFESTKHLNAIENGAKNVIKILLNKDVDLQVIGGTINKLVTQLGNVMNKSHDVAIKGQKVYKKAQEIQLKFNDLKVSASALGEGPVRTRIELARALAKDTKSMIKEFPSLFGLSQKTLEAAGINNDWIQRFGGNVEDLTTSLGQVLDKTDKVLKATDIVVVGVEDIRENLPIIRKSFKNLAEASWDKKIPMAQHVAKEIETVFGIAIDTTLKSANALNYSLTKNDLKSALETVIGKGRVAKFQGLYKNVTTMMIKLQSGPITNIGKLTDSVENFVEGLEGYEFGKMLLQNPTNLRQKLQEFQQLSQIAGGILRNISQITGLCKTCDASSVFGTGFIKSFSGRLETKFEQIGTDISNVMKRVDTGLKGWEQLVGVANGISTHFKGIRDQKVTRETFDKVSEALFKSSSDVLKFTNGSSDIFKALFDGDEDMKFLQQNFEGLVSQVSGVLNKSSIILPKVGDVFQSVQDVKGIFNEIKENIDAVQDGPIESRIQVLRKIAKGINGIGKTLPVILGQSGDVISELGIDSSWFRRVSGRFVNVSRSLSDVVNKTDTVLKGAALAMPDIRTIQGLATSVSQDYDKLLRAPWKQKFKIFENTLGKVDQMLNSTESIASVFDQTLKNISGIDFDLTDRFGNITNKVSGMIGNMSSAVKKVAVIYGDITATIDTIKSGPIEKNWEINRCNEGFCQVAKELQSCGNISTRTKVC